MDYILTLQSAGPDKIYEKLDTDCKQIDVKELEFEYYDFETTIQTESDRLICWEPRGKCRYPEFILLFRHDKDIFNLVYFGLGKVNEPRFNPGDFVC